jgi:hypothetical protein
MYVLFCVQSVVSSVYSLCLPQDFQPDAFEWYRDVRTKTEGLLQSAATGMRNWWDLCNVDGDLCKFTRTSFCRLLYRRLRLKEVLGKHGLSPREWLVVQHDPAALSWCQNLEVPDDDTVVRYLQLNRMNLCVAIDECQNLIRATQGSRYPRSTLPGE